MEPITRKQEKFLKYLVCKAVDYGRRMYIKGNKLGYVVPIFLPKDYDFLVSFEEVTKDDARSLISALLYAKDNDNDLSKVESAIAEKVYLDEQEFTLADFIIGKRVIVGIELDDDD